MEFIDLVINVFQEERKIQKEWPCLQVVPLALIGNTGEEAGWSQVHFCSHTELEYLVRHLKRGAE